MIDLSSTFVVNSHGCGGRPVLVGREYRCSKDGHRLAINGVPPIESRKRPPWTWHRELIDRRKARATHR